MEKFTILRGAAAPLLIDNINTDQIAPVQFMRALEPDYQTALFARWRSDSGKPFVLDMPRFQSRADPCHWSQFRLRQRARGRRLGAGRPWRALHRRP